MNRNAFIEIRVGAVLISLAVASIIGCSSSDNGSEVTEPIAAPVTTCLEKGALSIIAENHGHSLTISKEDIAASKEKTYDIQGFSEHNHTVKVTADDFSAMKRASRVVDIYSSTEEDHRHSIVIGCAP